MSRFGVFLAGALLATIGGCAAPSRDLATERDALQARAGRGDAAASRDLGLAALGLGDLAAAETGLRAALRGVPDARTRFGLGVILHDRGQVKDARDQWTALLEEADPRDPFAAPLAEVAAHRLLSLASEPAGTVAEERAFAERLRRLSARAERLPPEARQLLFAVTGQLLRLAGREAEARALDTVRGCPAAFFVTGPHGTLPRLDLLTPFAADAPDRDPGRGGYRRVSGHGCQIDLEGAHGKPGVMYAITWAKAEAATVVPVVIESGGEPFALLVDGQLRHHEREPVRRRHLALALDPGWHAVALKVAVPAGRVQVQLALPGLRLHDGAAPPVPAPAPSPSAGANARATLRPLSPAPPPRRPTEILLRDLILAQQAFLSGATDDGLAAVARLLGRAPRCAPALVLRAGLLADDPSRPQRIVRDRVRRALQAALKEHPGLHRTRLNLGHLLLQEDHADKALELLDADLRLAGVTDPARRAAAVDWEALLLRYRVLKARGWLREAEAALYAARAAGPAACTVLDALGDLRRELKDERGVLDLARAGRDCNPYSDRLGEVLRAAGDLPGAAAEYRRLLSLEPESEAHQNALLDTLLSAPLTTASRAEAHRLLAGLIRRTPRAAGPRIKLANLLIGEGDRPGAEAALRAGLSVVPESLELQRAVLAFGGQGPMAAYRRDGQEIIRDYKARRDAGRTAPGEAAVIVLDRTVTRVLPGGARLTLTHNIMQVLSKDGIDKFGEVQVPEGAEVLTLRTVKADGSTREPEEIAEKDTVSVPDLESGDFVEFEYVDRDGPAPAFPGGFLGERFFFASGDAPLFRTEYVLVTPAAMAVQIDRRAPAEGAEGREPPRLPSATESVSEGERVQVWARRDVPRLQPEPPQADGLAAEWVPSVRPGAGVSFARWRDYLRDRLALVPRSNAELRELAQGARGDTAEARARWLTAWVRRNIKQSGGLDEAATEILARREGHRVTLLLALLRAAGIPGELWLVRPVTAALLDSDLPNVEVYTEPLVVLRGAGGPLYLDPSYRHAPEGFVRPALRGGQALRVGALGDTSARKGDDPLYARVDLPPAGGVPADRRELRMSLSLLADGSGEVTVHERLSGWPAVEWREELERLPEDKVRQELEQRSLGFFFPGASLVDLSYGPVDDDGKPLEVRYRFRAPRLLRLRKSSGTAELVLPAPYPALLGKRYVGVPHRRTPLLLSYVVPTVLDATIELPKGAGVPRLSPPLSLSAFGHFLQRVEAGPRPHLHAEFAQPILRVSPQRYADFVRYTRTVDSAEDAALVIPLGPP